ncbi:glycosyltransferase involved in cell wall biosynthesis [Microbacterium sp. 1154]|uniref:glycosyltransferase n=1 Tax=Microbacterium sp. 1154 TaxID=2817733 RepID=UPI0028625D9D|nr:glycosyltransferase [Microbacterium sp. 1154]MDR6691209.1 glycosyltransferase involved in cell wall biosynthesis [Microbacterium sp. 1154]
MSPDANFAVLAYPSNREALSNPYVRLLYDEAAGGHFQIESFSIRGALMRRADIVHLHWPEWTIVQRSPWKAYPRLLAFMAVIWLARARGAAIVWTVHNLHPHRRVSRLREALLYTFLRRAVDRQIHLTEATHRAMEDTQHPARVRRRTVIEHGALVDRASVPEPGAFRQKNGVPADARLIVFFGGIDRYKGVPDLISAFGELDDPNSRLAICGKFADRSIERQVLEAARTDNRVLVRPGYLPEEELAQLAADADLIVLPYAAGLNSGSVFYALSVPRPVLVPRTDTFVAVSRAVGDGWVHTYRGLLTSQAIEAALSSRTPPAHPKIPSWRTIWLQTEAVYAEAIAERRGRA